MLVQRASSYFRTNRNRPLSHALVRLSESPEVSGRRLRVLDVGGSQSFWRTVAPPPIELTILNGPASFHKAEWFPERPEVGGSSGPDAPRLIVGDALDLSPHHGAFDVVVCNSVIEHVGDWEAMRRCARELRQVAPRGWVQTPAHGFPVEPHYALPFVHWLPMPLKAGVLLHVPHRNSPPERTREYARWTAERINLLTRAELRHLFDWADIRSERVLGITKSFVATWGMDLDPSAPHRPAVEVTHPAEAV